MENNNNSSKEILKVDNYYLNRSSLSENDKSNNVNHGGDHLSQTDSEDSIDDNLTRFDKYVYTFLLCYANLTYVRYRKITMCIIN